MAPAARGSFAAGDHPWSRDITVEPTPVAPARGVLRRILANAGMLLGGRTVNAVISLAYLALAARALGVAAFGALVLIHAFAQLLGDVVKFQSWQTILQYGARPLAEDRRPEFQQVLRFSVVLDLISSLVGVLIGVAGVLLFSPALGWPADSAPAGAAYMVSVVFIVSATSMGLLRLFDRFDVMAHQPVIISLVRLAGAGICFLVDAPLEAFLVVWAAGTAAGFAYLVWGAVRELRRRELLEGATLRGPLGAGLPGIWRFAWTTNLSTALDTAFTHVVTLMVGAFVGAAEAGFWRIGRQVADAIAKPAKLLVPALYPELVRLRMGEGERQMGRIALQVGMLAGGFGLVLLAVTAFAGRWLLTLIMGADFAPAAELMTWLVAAAVIGVLAVPLEPMLVSLGRPGAALRVRLVVSLAFLGALPFIVDRFGAQGAAIGLGIAAAALAIGMLAMLLLRGGSARGGNKPLAVPHPDT